MTVSVLGLGAMGSRLAATLAAAGHTVTVWNRTPTGAPAGTALADSLAHAAAASELVIAMVRDDDASRAVWEGGALDGLREGALAIEMSTLTPDRARELAAAVRERGGHFLDAPVVGTRPHVESGILTVLVGGDAADLDAARPVFEPVAGAVHHVGPHGTGMAMKLAVNALFAIQAAAVAELLPALAAEGLAPETAAALLGRMPTASPAGARIGELIAAGHTSPNFPIALVAKDLGYAVGLTDAAGVASRAVAGTARAFSDAEAAGLGALDIAAVGRLYSSSIG